LKALFDRFRTRGSGSLTAQARRLSVDDLSSHQQDFFTVAKRPAPNGRIIAALAVTMVAGSAAMGVVIATSGSGKDTASVRKPLVLWPPEQALSGNRFRQ
jgi:hypothetical protein